MSRAGRVAEVLAAVGEATAAEIGDKLGVREYQEKNKIQDAIADLKRRGVVESVTTPGASVRYRLVEGRQAGRGIKQDRLWRAMQLKTEQAGAFSYREVALLAEASRDYAKRYVRHCRGLGAVTGQGGRWRVAPEMRHAAAPVYCRREADRATTAPTAPDRRGRVIRINEMAQSMLQTLDGLRTQTEELLAVLEEEVADGAESGHQ